MKVKPSLSSAAFQVLFKMPPNAGGMLARFSKPLRANHFNARTCVLAYNTGDLLACTGAVGANENPIVPTRLAIWVVRCGQGDEKTKSIPASP